MCKSLISIANTTRYRSINCNPPPMCNLTNKAVAKNGPVYQTLLQCMRYCIIGAILKNYTTHAHGDHH